MNITVRRPYRLSGTVRRTLFDTRNFLRELNRHSDELGDKLRCIRVGEAQKHYEEAKVLIAKIDEILK